LKYRATHVDAAQPSVFPRFAYDAIIDAYARDARPSDAARAP
jgi:hypothetical protein